MFNPQNVMRLVQDESDGCMYARGWDEEGDSYVKSEDYDLLLADWQRLKIKISESDPGYASTTPWGV